MNRVKSAILTVFEWMYSATFHLGTYIAYRNPVYLFIYCIKTTKHFKYGSLRSLSFKYPASKILTVPITPIIIPIALIYWMSHYCTINRNVSLAWGESVWYLCLLLSLQWVKVCSAVRWNYVWNHKILWNS